VSPPEPVYNLTAIRRLLLDAFTATTLRHFCQDRPLFRPVLDYVSQRPSKVELVDALIEHCQTRLLWEELLAEVKADNPRQYERYKDQLPLPGAGATTRGQAGLAPDVLLCPEEEDGAACVGSIHSRIYHRPDCHHANRIQPTNRLCFATPAAAHRDGRLACRVCRP
jgi:hypothetical protein